MRLLNFLTEGSKLIENFLIYKYLKNTLAKGTNCRILLLLADIAMMTQGLNILNTRCMR